MTSLGAIAGLSLAWAFGWSFMDPLVGLLGTIVMVTWAVPLVYAMQLAAMPVGFRHLTAFLRRLNHSIHNGGSSPAHRRG